MKPIIILLICASLGQTNILFAQEVKAISFDQLYAGEHYGDWQSTLQVLSGQREKIENIHWSTRAKSNKDAQLTMSIETANSCAINRLPNFMGRIEDFIKVKTINANDPTCPTCLKEMKATIKQNYSQVTWKVDGQEFKFEQKINASELSGLSLGEPQEQNVVPLLNALEHGRWLSIQIAGMPLARFSLDGYLQIKNYALELCTNGNFAPK
jgi:hypothetical protein